MAKLTIKQEKFCNNYIECGNATEAYRYAYSSNGMSENAIGVEACNLLKNPNITLRLSELQSELKSKSDVTKVDKLHLLESIFNSQHLDIDNRNTMCRIKAIEVHNKMVGDDAPSKHEIKTAVNIDLLEGLSKAELIDMIGDGDFNTEPLRIEVVQVVKNNN